MMNWIWTTIKRLFCLMKGHTCIVLEVHTNKDLLRCTRCNKIGGSYGRL